MGNNKYIKVLNKVISYWQLSTVMVMLSLVLLSQDISAQPVVVTQPQDTSICVETSAGFSIIAVNTSGYQWQENDGVGWYNLNSTFTYVDGEYTPDLIINDANLALNDYQYRCIVNDIDDDKDTSLPATLGVYEPPIIIEHPINQRVCKSDIALFLIDAINGTNYQWLEYNGVGWLEIIDNSFYDGAQTSILNVYTVTGMDGFMYRCVAKNVTCPDTSDIAILNVDPTPIVYGVTGGGEYCEGSQGVLIGLNGSEIGISYNLLRDGIETGIVVEGTGELFDFGTQILDGQYSVIAYNQFTSCNSEMGNYVTVVINELPIDYQVYGGGSICIGEVFPDIFMLNSEIGVDYSLFNNAVYTGITMSGTGMSLNFGSHQNPGYYTVIAENMVVGCSRQMNGIPEIIIMELPIANAGTNHNIIQGDFAQLQGNANGGSGSYNYNWSPTNLCVSPTSTSTRTTNLYISTIFTFTVTDLESGCNSFPDTSIVYVNSGPLNVQVFSSNNNVCLGESVNLIALAAGGTGNYSYLWTSSPPGFTSTSSSPEVVPTESTIYTVTVSDGVENVENTLSINIFPLPTIFDINNGGDYCSGGEGIEITLDGSEIGIRYNLYYQESSIDNILGDNQPLSFGNYTQQGTYSVIAQNDNTGCISTQNGVANINVNQLPVAEAGPNNLINAGEFATLSGSASGGTGGHFYSWSPTVFLINPLSQNPSTIQLDNTTMFNLIVTDDAGCNSVEDNTIVFVAGGQISLDIMTSSGTVCPESEVQLYAMASGGSGSFSYFWQSNPSGYTSTSYNPIVTPLITTTYIVSVNDGLEVLQDSVTIVVNPSPIAFNLSGGGEVCHGDNPSNIILNGSEIGVDYQLLRDGGNTDMIISGTGFVLDFGNWNSNGNYTTYAINLSSLCNNKMNGDANVTVYPLPISNAGLDQLITGGSTTILSGAAVGGSGSYEYQWEPSYLCESPISQNTLTLPISQTTLFSLFVSDVQTQCISEPDTAFIYTNGDDLYASGTASPSTLCAEYELSLSAIAGGGTGNYSYTWTSMPEGYYSSQQYSIDFPLVNTAYYLDVFDGISHSYDTIIINVLPTPILFNITGGGNFCSGDEGMLIGLASSEIGASYSLFRKPEELIGNLNGTSQLLDFGSFTQSGSYYITSNINGLCQQTMIGEAIIIVNQKPIADAGENQIIQSNTQTFLSGSATLGSGDYNYNWSPADSLINPNIQQPQTVPLSSTLMYNLVVTNNNTGCISDEDNSIVFVTGGLFTLQVTSNVSSACPGVETQLYSFPSGGSGNYSYSWTSVPSGFSSNVCCPVVSPMVTTTYTVNITDGSTTLTDFVTIEVSPLPLAYSISGGGAFCSGQQSDNIILENSQENTTYSLLGNGSITGTHIGGTGFPVNFGTVTEEGEYSIFAIENTTQCSNYMAGDVSISINPLPVVFAGQDVIIPANSETTLTGEANGGSGSYSYYWQPAVLVQNPQYQSTITNPIPHSTLFTFNATDLQNNCTSLGDSVFVFTIGDELYVDATSSSIAICNSDFITLLALPGGGTGSYSFSWTSIPSGFVSTQINPTVQLQQSTTFYIEVFDGLNYAYDSIFIQVLQNPNIYTITGGGSYCYGENGKDIGLSDSEQGMLYRLFHFPDIALADVIGTGSELLFGTYALDGDFFAIANADNTCQELMNGVASIVVNQLPEAHAGNDKYIEWGNQVMLNGSATGGSGSYNYSWIPSDSLLNSFINDPTTVPLHTSEIFDLSVSDSETGCVGYNDNTVVFVSGGNFYLNISTSNETICSGEATQLTAIPTGGLGNYSYIWSSSPEGFTSDIYNPIVQPNVTTTYSVTVIDGLNTVTDSIIIVVIPTPIIYNLNGGGTYCEGSNGVEIILDGSSHSINYELFNNLGSTDIILPGSGNAISFGIHNNEGYYWAIGIDAVVGCASTMEDTVIISMNMPPVANAGFDQYIEQGTSAQFDGSASGGSGYFNYNWFPDYLFINSNVQNVVTTPLNQSTMFNLMVDDAVNGCIGDADTVIAYITDTELLINVNATPSLLCEGGDVHLSVLPSGGTGNYSYNWYSNPVGYYSNNQFAIAFPNESTTYFVEVSDGITVVFESIFVEVTQSPEVFVLFGGGSYCLNGNGVNIALSGSQEFVEYTLFRNQGIEVVSLLGDGLPVDFGEYKVSGSYFVLAGNNETGCLTQMAGLVVVNQFSQPMADAGEDITIAIGDNVTLNGSAYGGLGTYSYLWTPTEELLNPTDPDATTLAINSTSLFSLQVTDQNGCESDKSNMIVFTSGGSLYVNAIIENNQVCSGNQISIYALPGGGNGNYSYFWESSPIGFNATSSQITVAPQIPTWYKVTITDGYNTVSDSVFVNMLPKPISYTLLGGGGYCSGFGGVDVYLENSSLSTIYTLYHNTVETGEYIFGTGSQISFGSIITEGTYSVIAQNEVGCSSLMQNTVQVYLNSKPEKFQLYGGGTYCENDPTLGIILESSELNVDYALYKDAIPTSIVVHGSGLPLSFDRFSGTGNYSIMATGVSTGCTNPMVGVAGLIIHDKPTISISGENNICFSEFTTLSATGGYNYEWNTSPPEHTPEITVSPAETTKYEVLGYNLDGCTDTASHVIEVNDKPSITIINDQVTLSIICYPDNLFNYDFYIGDVLLQGSSSNTWYYGDKGLISDSITVIASTQHGCSDEGIVYVEMKDPPNAFTPDGDGVNDLFLVGYDITVYSSWGGEIFKGDTGWDGKYNGMAVVPGTYYYIHHIFNTEGAIIKTIKGSVTVVIE